MIINCQTAGNIEKHCFSGLEKQAVNFIGNVNEVKMAKRRNLKKEKAQRNQAYARKFRKRKNLGRFTKNRRFSKPPREDGQEDDSDADSLNRDYFAP